MSLLAAMAGLALAHPFAEEALAAAPPGCADGGARWLKVAESFAEEDRLEEASDALARARACGMEEGVLAAYRALLDARGRDPAQALPLLDEALRVHEGHLGLRLARARVLAELGMLEAASEDWTYAFQHLARPSPDEVLRWAQVLMQAGDPRRALEVLDSAIERLGPAPSLVCAAVDAELALGWTAAALGRLDGLPDTPYWRERREQALRSVLPYVMPHRLPGAGEGGEP